MYWSRIFRYTLFLLMVEFLFSNGSKMHGERERGDFDESTEKTQMMFKRHQTHRNKGKSLDRYVISAEARHQFPSYSAQNPLKLDSQSISEMVSVNFNSSEAVRMFVDQCIDDRPIICMSDSRYRNIDGSCNNLKKPNCGRTFSRLERLEKPDYANGIDAPRMGCNGPLPEPRIISFRIHSLQNNSQQSELGTTLLMSFGQFISHNVAFITPSTNDDGSSIQCCSDSLNNHPACMPIKIPENDPVFPTRCMNFVRRAPYPGYSFGWRDQMNSLTPALDCSMVYGSTDELAKSLRTLDGTGQLKSSFNKIAGELLPLSDDQATSQCIQKYPAFIAGDFRVNQNPVLTCLHTIYLRFHNRIAKELKYLNPCWDDEKIYQETRRIVIACHQRIIYTEFLPLIIGHHYMDKFDLDDENTEYNDKEYLKTWSEFLTGVYRLHTLIPNIIHMDSETGKTEFALLADHYFNTRLIHTGRLDDLIRGATVQREDEFDRILSDSVTKFLYTQNVTVVGLDLAAINIQRGRDHGMRGFTYYAEKIYRKAINNFEDLRGILREDCIYKLRELYRCVDDIDFYTGIICEEQCRNNALVGCTAVNIIAKQFSDLKFDQIKAIKNINLATIICYTTNIQRLKRYPLKVRSYKKKCSEIPQINLSPWKEC